MNRDQRGQSLVIVLSLITILFLLGSALAVHASAALRATRANEGQGDNFYAADAATELGIWWQRNGKSGNPPAQTINGVTTSTTITSAGGGGGGSCPSGSPTPIFMTGMESGALPSRTTSSVLTTGAASYVISWYGTPGDTTVVTSPARTGSYALRIHPQVSLGAYADTRTNCACGVNWTGQLVARFSARFEVLPTADAGIAWFTISGGVTYPYLLVYYHQSTGKLALSWGSTSYAVPLDSSVTAIAGTWHDFDLRITPNTNPTVAEWYVDGIQQPDFTYAQSGGTGFQNFTFGRILGPSIDYSVYIDDIEVTNTGSDYPLGNVKIAPLLPNGMGTNNDATKFQNNDSTAINATSWQRVDDVPMTGTTDYIKQTGFSTGAEYIEIAFQDTTETCTRGASLVAAIRAATSSPDNAAINHVMNGVNVTLWAGDASETFLRYALRPVSTNGGTAGVGPWTQAAVNSIVARLGMSTDVNPNPYFDSVILEYGYRPLGGGGPATVTIVGTGSGSTVTTTYPDAGAGVPTLSTWTATQ